MLLVVVDMDAVPAHVDFFALLGIADVHALREADVDVILLGVFRALPSGLLLRGIGRLFGFPRITAGNARVLAAVGSAKASRWLRRAAQVALRSSWRCSTPLPPICSSFCPACH